MGGNVEGDDTADAPTENIEVLLSGKCLSSLSEKNENQEIEASPMGVSGVSALADSEYTAP